MNLRSTLIAAGAAVTLLAAGSLGAISTASAQTPGQTPPAAEGNGQHVRQDFFSRLAATLNVSLDQFKAAVKSAELQTVDDLVADGTLTADQGAKIKDKINSNDGLAIGRFLREHRGHYGPGGPGELRERVRRLVVVSSAKAIGITPKELVGDLKGGQSIADVATAHGVSLDTVKAAITADAKAALDKAVANGKMTQAREDAALQKLADQLDTILNKKKA
jgi:hypothetical protein